MLGRAWPEPGEPLFLPEDTTAALARVQERNSQCPHCGIPAELGQDPKQERKWRAKVYVCHACRAGHARLNKLDDPSGALAAPYLE